jgi:hypothetical protein
MSGALKRSVLGGAKKPRHLQAGLASENFGMWNLLEL